jgi:hypothetical protein
VTLVSSTFGGSLERFSGLAKIHLGNDASHFGVSWEIGLNPSTRMMS